MCSTDLLFRNKPNLGIEGEEIKPVKEVETRRYEGKSTLFNLEKDREENSSPMIIIGTLHDSGLGLTEWWKSKEGAEEEENNEPEEENNAMETT